MRRGRWAIGHVLVGMAVACGGASEKREEPKKTAAQQRAEPDPAAVEAQRKAELAHRVVFADRISFGYVLLIPGSPGPAPSRADLQAIVRRAFADNVADKEVELLLDFVMTPRRADLGSVAAPDDKDRVEAPADPQAAERVWATSDLLGLEVEAVPIAAVPGKALADPELTRALSPEERESLPKRQQAVILRALYRNQNGVRGLRLLQALVRVAAAELGALVYDPDTQETMGPAVFAARRLQTSLGNISDQVAVVPFPDAGAGENAIRLATRGMRRFGSVDLELGGLPRDLVTLQQATYVLHGLGLVMVRLGEFDSSGFAVEAPDAITVHYRDCAAAYGGQVALPRCQGCPEHADVHLVERPEEPHDPPGHVVARVVAPRAIGEQPGHDHRAWVQGMLGQILGRPAP